jgi:hypothetical protein
LGRILHRAYRQTVTSLLTAAHQSPKLDSAIYLTPKVTTYSSTSSTMKV